MGYSVKWVVENLGITRDMLRYYEKEKRLPTNESRNPANKYRDYSDEDIERIWGIKLLIGIGFTAKEIYALMNDQDFDFDAAIAKKVADLERKHDENLIHLEFAKSIKFMGCVPTTSKIGSIKFDDFLEYAHKNWNFYDGPRSAPFMQMADTLISKAPQEWSPDDVERILEMFEKFDAEGMMHTYALHGYYQVISDMKDLGYDSDTVQRVVKLLHEYNQTFHVNFDTSAGKFQNYYKDLSQRVKAREVDLLIVVNMFLTGFDATTLNTLWVDKNLKMHGLIQAFSRTNRILNSVKTYGNIVCFRNLQKATDDAIALFGDREASGVVLLKGYDAYYDGYEENGKAVPG